MSDFSDDAQREYGDALAEGKLDSPSQDNKPTSIEVILKADLEQFIASYQEHISLHPDDIFTPAMFTHAEAIAAIAALYESAVPKDYIRPLGVSDDHERGFLETIDQIHANFKQIRGGKL